MGLFKSIAGLVSRKAWGEAMVENFTENVKSIGVRSPGMPRVVQLQEAWIWQFTKVPGILNLDWDHPYCSSTVSAFFSCLSPPHDARAMALEVVHRIDERVFFRETGFAFEYAGTTRPIFDLFYQNKHHQLYELFSLNNPKCPQLDAWIDKHFFSSVNFFESTLNRHLGGRRSLFDNNLAEIIQIRKDHNIG